MKRKMPRLREGWLVEVYWHDAWASTGWQEADWWATGGSVNIVSVGYVKKTSGNELLLAGNRDLTPENGGRDGHPMAIPWGCIDKIDIIKRKSHAVK